MKVLCLWYATEREIEQIKAALPDGAEVVAPEGEYFSRFESNYAALEHHAADADAFIGFALPEGILEIAENLKILCYLHSGVDDLKLIGALSLAKQRGVKVTNIRGANAAAVAEHAMMFVLALAKQTLFKHQAALGGRMLFPLYADEYRSAMLQGRTIGVIGVGNIGSRIAKHAKAFEMNVVGVRRSKEKPAEFVDSMYGMEELHSVLPQCDYVVLATPNTTETYHSIGYSELDAMKPSAFLVNVSRGNLIQEKPLHDALTSGRLRGFATDVRWKYDFGRSFPTGWTSRLSIQELPNVIFSGDQAANADDVLERDLQWGTQSLMEFEAGKPLTYEVDLDLGY